MVNLVQYGESRHLSAKKVVSDILAKIAFFALTGVYGQETLSGKVLHLDFV